MYLNPRTHVGCDGGQGGGGCFGSDISIHAPTWGATVRLVHLPPHIFISIHAPTWGATGAPVVEVAVFHDFNPRTHVGCDIDAWHVCWPSCVFQSTHPRGVRPLRPDGVLPKRIISIHAPTWGATSAASRCSRSGRNFNPRTHVGCDEVYEAVLGWLREFQSTHPRGVRRDDRDDDHREKDISIHAPTWGATWLRTSDTTMSSYFNPRTHVGCDSSVMPRSGRIS